MLSDSTGHFPILITLILVAGAIIGGSVGGKSAYDNAVSAGKTGSDLFWSTMGGVAIGGSVGVAAAGLALAGGTAIYAGIMFAAKGVALSALTVFGLSATKVVAIGLLAYSGFATIVAPILGLTVELVGWIADKDKTKVKKPGETPRHPAGNQFLNIFSNKEATIYDRIFWWTFG